MAALHGIPGSTIDELSGMDFVTRDAWVWRKTQLHIDFRSVRKSGGFWTGYNEESRSSSRWECSKPGYALHVFSMRD